MFSLHQTLWRFNLPAILAFLTIIAFSCVRFIFTVISWPQLNHDIAELASVFLRGLLFDGVVATYVYGVFAILGIFIPEKWRQSAWGHKVTLVIAGSYLFALGFVVVAEWFFWQEFSVRFNFIAVDYLVYRREVTGNISESYPVIPILSTVTVIVLAITYLLRSQIQDSINHPLNKKHRIISLTTAILVMLSVGQLRGNDVPQLSNNMYIEELARNGVFQFFYAFTHNQLDYSIFYKTAANVEQASEQLKANVVLPHEQLLKPQTLFDVTRQVDVPEAERRLNIMLVTVESLSGDYMAALGNQENLTPHLDALSKQGLFFSQYYATGNRTVRGLEALTLGIPPSAGSAVVRRPNNHGLFSLASVLNKKGYDSKFIYGGYGYFDNMNTFFAGNGYQVIDRTDFSEDEKSFANVWGVADEYVYLRALREADKSYVLKKPFFSIVLSTSNHRPYTFPQGRIEAPQKKWRSAVKYTDWAIANFIKQAKQKPWFNDTIFVISADHCAGSAGKTAMPVERYHIPLIMYAPKYISPKHIDQLASQMDVPATILGLLNMDYVSRFVGRDILRTPKHQQRALIATYQRLALYKNDDLVILSPQKHLEIHRQPLTTDEIVGAEANPALIQEAISYYQGTDYMLKHGLLRAIP